MDCNFPPLYFPIDIRLVARTHSVPTTRFNLPIIIHQPKTTPIPPAQNKNDENHHNKQQTAKFMNPTKPQPTKKQ